MNRATIAPANASLEPLERRRLLCALHGMTDKPARELRPDLVGKQIQINEPADIVWTNRATTTAGGTGDTDSFGARFGTLAPVARAVVDSVIVAFERMVGSFNYSTAGTTYSMSLSMGAAGGGFGASASLTTLLGGIPKGGSVTMGAGTNTADPNDANGWFVDPTPEESSEFLGNITNAFSGDAQAGSPASGKGDFYTVVAAEMTHCLGMSSANPPGWSAHVTNTGIPDTAEGGGVGTFYVFNGPSIKHLETSNNGGPGGSARATAVHAAGPNVNVSFNGDTYVGAQDHGNAVYEFSRRYTVNNVFALMYKDAFGYLTVNPAKWGTFYSVRNSTTNAITVRGGTGTSADNISITRSGSTISVSVDVGNDVPGTGALPGAGNLPAFVTEYDISEVGSIVIQAGAGDDTITIDAGVGVPVSVDGGTNTDTVIINGTSGNDTFLVTSSGASGSANVSITAGLENLTINGNDGTDTIDVQGNPTSSPAVLVLNSPGSDVVNVNTDNAGTAAVRFDSTMSLGALNVGAGGLSTLSADGSRVLVTNALSIDATGKVDLNDNDLILQPGAVGTVQSMVTLARNGGDWLGAGGLTSTAARTNGVHNTTLGVMSAGDYWSIYGTDATFDGQAIDATAVLVKYTYYGDADFSGTVNFDDYVNIDVGYNVQLTGWLHGDFNSDGLVNFDDYVLIDTAYNTQGAVLQLAVIKERARRRVRA